MGVHRTAPFVPSQDTKLWKTCAGAATPTWIPPPTNSKLSILLQYKLFHQLAVYKAKYTWATISYASSESSSGTNYTIATPYQYPVKSGTDEWRALTNHAEKVELFQIPEDILPLMTTEALAKTVKMQIVMKAMASCQLFFIMFPPNLTVNISPFL